MQHHYAAKAVLCLRRKAEVEQEYTIALDAEVTHRHQAEEN
jgi:hypothetical protein